MSGYRPSKRRHKVESDVELSLIPVMSLLVVLVPMLLQTAVFEQLAALQLSLPSVDEVIYSDEPPPQEKGDESVTLAVTSEGFRFISAEATVKTVAPDAAGKFDFDALAVALADIKKTFDKQEAIILLIENDVVYDDIVHTMDTCRPYFPGVSMADFIGGEPGEEAN